MASTEAQKKASAKYDKENTVQIALRLNKNTDDDILDYLERIGNVGASKQGFIKMAIRHVINRIEEADIYMSDKALLNCKTINELDIRNHINSKVYDLDIEYNPDENEIYVTTGRTESLHRYAYNWSKYRWELNE